VFTLLHLIKFDLRPSIKREREREREGENRTTDMAGCCDVTYCGGG